MVASVERISPNEGHERVESGEALLVCAYEDAEKCAKNHLEGGLSLDEFQAQADSLPRDKEILFFCA